MKMVKVARVGSKIEEVAVHSNATIAQCLAAANIRMEENEDVYENHVLQNTGCNALENAIIIVEPRKRQQLSYGLIRLINYLMEEDIIEGDDYEDEDCIVNFNDLYDDNKLFIDELISKAKEA